MVFGLPKPICTTGFSDNTQLKSWSKTGRANHHHHHNDYNKMQVDEEKEEKDFYAAAADCPVVPEMGAMGLIG